MGKKQVLDWLENDMSELMDTGFEAMECIQRQGDILIVPELWVGLTSHVFVVFILSMIFISHPYQLRSNFSYIHFIRATQC